MLSDLIKGYIDILLVSETKIDSSFPTPQFLIPGFLPPFRLDRSKNGGGLLLYVREDIPTNEVPCKSISQIECILIDINMHKKIWLIYGIYNPEKSFTSSFLSNLSRSLDNHNQHYDDIILLGDFNADMLDDNLNDFCHLYNFKNLIREPTCYKNPLNPSCIDLIITNRPNSFQDSNVIETGLP